MDSIGGEAEYYGKCGEMFLTIKGNIAFHCTFCEDRFKNFQEYSDHIFETHYAPDLKEEVLSDGMNEEEEFDPLSEESFPANVDKFLVKEEDDVETCISHKVFNHLIDSQSEDTTVESSPEEFQTEDSNKTVLNDIVPDEAIRPTIRTVNVKPTIKNRKFKCPICGFTGADKGNIRKHIQRHSLNKPHKCTDCGKAFHTRTELTVHMRLHTGERPYLCNDCGRSFITSGKLSDHQKRHENKRDKECPICKMGFINSHLLRGHMAIHSDKRQYKCTKCEASFKLCGALGNHMKLHENKRAYQCKLCDSKFNQNAGLYSHMKTCHTVVANSQNTSFD